MWHNQFKVAFRNISKHKLFSIINIAGLAVGLASFLIIYRFVQEELSYDKHFPNSERVFRISGQYDQGGDGLTTTATTPFQLAPFLKENFYEIESITRLSFQSRPIRIDDQFFMEDDIYYGDDTFFKVFGYPFLSGSPSEALSNPSSVVISEEISERYFPDSNPIGEVIDFSGFNAKVTGVFQNSAGRSHINPSFVISMSTVESDLPHWMRTNWGGTSHWTYFLLNEGDSQAGLADRFSKLVNDTHNQEGYEHHYFFQPISEIHLESNINGEIEANGDILYVYIFSIVGFVVLLVAGINYINLSTANSTYRIKEVGMRRTMGAGKKHMIVQFQIESIVIALIAGFIGVILVELFTPKFNELTGQSLSLNIFESLDLMALMTGLSVLIGIIAGTFPGWFLLRYKVIDALKGKISNSREKLPLRSVLVVCQFAISIMLIAGTLVVFKQLDYMKTKDIGINTQHVIQVPLQTFEIVNQLDVFKQKLKEHENVINVGAANNSVTNRVGGWRGYKLDDSDERVNVSTIIVDMDFLPTLEASITEGRNFESTRQTDYNKAYIINESAKKFLNLENAVGSNIEGAVFTGEVWGRKEAKIIGVVKDFNFASLHTSIQPLVFSLHTESTMNLQNMIIRIKGNDIQSTIEHIENTWRELAPERPFIYDFLDDELAQHYVAEDRFFNLFTIFSILAICIGCMGLFGLSVYTVQRKIKEIGIRKVLGARVGGLVTHLSWNFLKLIMMANFLALPVAYYYMDMWLDNYAFRININVLPFVIAGSISIVIAFTTVSIQTLKSALSNPVHALKDE